ncbi:hypothetical protein [Shimia aestuarii]|uniref:hypothetical protein n=1 Tax=Shimia aestuarii TaxID=254406 RepID=UPI001FB4158D|nr:hypothetical protein [Shimia aestuarii]
MNDAAKEELARHLGRISAEVAQICSKLADNEYELIPTSRGMEAIVDRQFAHEVSRYRWFAVVSRGNHVQVAADVDGRRVGLPRLVLHLANPEKAIKDIKNVSYKNKNAMDCRLSNLENRVGRQAVMRNRRKKRDSSSRFKGVKHLKSAGKWSASISDGERVIYLGSHEHEEFAAAVYDAAASMLFEGAAHYNLPNERIELDAMHEATMRIKRHRTRWTARSEAKQNLEAWALGRKK